MIELRHPTSEQILQLSPEAGCCGVSWSIHGQEFLHLSQPLQQFLKEEHTGGLPLLYPWANRLRSNDWTFEDQTVDLHGMDRVHRDGNGLPMHGLLLRWPDWSLSIHENHCTASIEWSDHDSLMQAFPFDHLLEVNWLIDENGLEVTTTIEARERSVPISFGWHPYMCLPGVVRKGISLELPALAQVVLDDRSLPVDEKPAWMPAATYELSERSWDDCFVGIQAGSRVLVHGGAMTIQFECTEGWKSIQIYSPSETDFVCIEPMTAMTAALSDDASDMNVVKAGDRFRASYRINVIDRI